jgi:hypothetical protein
MDVNRLEQAVLRLAFEAEAPITTASVAYYLGIPSRQANQLLNQLLSEGTLELDSDGVGNLYYRVPTCVSAQNVAALKRGEMRNHAAAQHARQRGIRSRVEQDPNPRRLISSDKEPPTSAGRPQSKNPVKKSVKDNSKWPTAARRMAATDATLETCGRSPLVVSTEVRCEPQAVAGRGQLTACDAREVSTRGEADWFDPKPMSTDLAIRDDNEEMDLYLEEPQHQPGMALLLSLILCGTGQIYNGEVTKGIIMMVLCFLLWFMLLGWVVHIWSIVDAVIVAERLNRSTE